MSNPKENSTKSAPGSPSLGIDWDLYGKMLEASDLTEEQKREFIETLWWIVRAFVDLGFGIHPVQQSCGETDDLARFIAGDVVGSDMRAEFDNAQMGGRGE